ncbi:MAG: TonB-dependent receptor [Cyclobacteriaceae bacterium]|nr:TonB-dependent receptor [Cyclobacteriaceae bacterium]
MKKIYPIMKITLLLLLLFQAGISFAQGRLVSGTIKDESNTGMPGVNIIIKGTTDGTVTDANGEYRINVPNDQATLVFSFVGYATQELVVGSRSSLDVQLALDVKSLSEIVVIGYGSQEKKDLTGSVGVVQTKELIQVPVGNVENQLQGRVAGVTVINSGQPGAAPQITIRGNGGFGNNNPLYVVDGVQTLDISTLNPNDVESISVLKDAGAASIYGTRAANGVILITTKRGQSGNVKVTYDTYVGTQDPGKGFTNLLNTQGMADLQWQVFSNGSSDKEKHPLYGDWVRGGAGPVIPNYILPSGASTVDESKYVVNKDGSGGNFQIVKSSQPGTNWFKESTRAARIQNHDLTLSGGTDKSNFLVSLNYFEQQGIVLETFTKRYSARVNSSFKIKDRVRIGQNLQVTYRTGRSIQNQSEGNSISQAYRMQPIVPVYDIRGNFAGSAAQTTGNGSSPVADLLRAKDNQQFDTRVLGNLFAEVDIVKDLIFRTSIGGTFQTGSGYSFGFPTWERSENVATSTFNEYSFYAADWTFSNTLNYRKKFGDHSINVLAGTEAIKYDIARSISGTRGDVFSFDPNFWNLSNGATIINVSSSINVPPFNVQTPTTNSSLFARADYSFNDKYYLTGSIRRDGSSRFQQQFGVFPAVTAAWRISGEDFFSGISSVVNDLKLRAGYGEMGNQARLTALNQFSLFGGGPGSSFYDISGTGNSSVQGLRPSQIGNPLARWETSVTSNIAVDLGLFNNKLQVTVDWYTRTSKDLLVQQQLPGTAGGGTAPFTNIGQITNTGFDIQLIYKTNFATDWRFDGNLTLTTINNRVDKIADGAPEFFEGGTRFGNTTINRVGQPLSAFYGYRTLGLFQSAADVAASPRQDGAAPGRFKFADTNGDNVITPDDRVIIGNPNPKFIMGLNLSLAYKAFDFSTFLYGAFGQDIFNYTKWWTDFWPSFQGNKSVDALNNSWLPTRTNAKTPIAENVSNFSTNNESNSYYIEKGSYLRARTIQIGYTLPQAKLSKVGIDRLRIYLQGANLFTITNYSGLDPELGSSSANNAATARGIDYGNYPIVKQFIIGANLTF